MQNKVIKITHLWSQAYRNYEKTASTYCCLHKYTYKYVKIIIYMKIIAAELLSTNAIYTYKCQCKIVGPQYPIQTYEVFVYWTPFTSSFRIMSFNHCGWDNGIGRVHKATLLELFQQKDVVDMWLSYLQYCCYMNGKMSWLEHNVQVLDLGWTSYLLLLLGGHPLV